MIWFTKNGQVATVVAISQSDYTLAVYASAIEQKTGAPLQQWTIHGSPSVIGILAALGSGWQNDSDDLPDLSAVPASVTARQIRLWLVQHSIPLSSVDAAIDSIADQLTRDIVRVEWEYAPYIERSHPWLVPLAESLGLNEEQIDQAFIEASII